MEKRDISKRMALHFFRFDKMKLNYRRQNLHFLHRNFVQGPEITTWYKKDLHDPDNHYDVLTHLEPDILECEIKWALGSITMNKASGGDGIPVELFQIFKNDAVKVLHSICQQIWKTQQWPQDWKRSVFIPIPKKGNAKECSNYRTIPLISHASTEKAMATHSSTLAMHRGAWWAAVHGVAKSRTWLKRLSSSSISNTC